MAHAFKNIQRILADTAFDGGHVRHPLMVDAWFAACGRHIHIELDHIHHCLEHSIDDGATARTSGN